MFKSVLEKCGPQRFDLTALIVERRIVRIVDDNFLASSPPSSSGTGQSFGKGPSNPRYCQPTMHMS